MTIHLGRPLPDASRDLPGRQRGNPLAVRNCRPPLLGLAPGGVYPAITVTGDAVRSYRTLSPLPAIALAGGSGRFAFCGTFPGVARRRVSRVLSPSRRASDDHSSGTSVAGRLARPTRAAARKRACDPKSLAAPTRSCSRWGLPCRPRRRERGALLPHPFTLTWGPYPKAGDRRFAFCGTFPGVAPAGR